VEKSDWITLILCATNIAVIVSIMIRDHYRRRLETLLVQQMRRRAVEVGRDARASWDNPTAAAIHDGQRLGIEWAASTMESTLRVKTEV
jgi:hypothetical protein